MSILTRSSRAHLAKLSVQKLDQVIAEIVGIREARREADKEKLRKQLVQMARKRGHRVEDVLGLAA